VLLEDQHLSLSDITANLLARHQKALQSKA
ncbi:MAG: bifunctional phosphoribosyl-AMP cyclohydrolase/phosphoribosyl-ATP diphosphatase HisIE, partial [Shewanella sp.]